jgi:hypothetical protein
MALALSHLILNGPIKYHFMPLPFFKARIHATCSGNLVEVLEHDFCA